MIPIQPRIKRAKRNNNITVCNPHTEHQSVVSDAGAVDQGFSHCHSSPSHNAELQSEVAVVGFAVDDLMGLANQLGRGPERPHPHAGHNDN